jgi:hypothetical protein
VTRFQFSNGRDAADSERLTDSNPTMQEPQKQPFDTLVEITKEMMRANLSRRTMLAAGGFAALTAAARAAGGFGNPDLPPEGAVNVANPKR